MDLDLPDISNEHVLTYSESLVNFLISNTMRRSDCGSLSLPLRLCCSSLSVTLYFLHRRHYTAVRSRVVLSESLSAGKYGKLLSLYILFFMTLKYVLGIRLPGHFMPYHSWKCLVSMFCRHHLRVLLSTRPPAPGPRSCASVLSGCTGGTTAVAHAHM